jgi:hypothetical protein
MSLGKAGVNDGKDEELVRLALDEDDPIKDSGIRLQ